MHLPTPSYDAHWSLYPRSYAAHRVSERVVIDGNLDKTPWLTVPFSEPFGDISSGSEADGTTQFKALFDDDYLYIAALLHPAPGLSTEAHFTERNSPIFQKDSDFEVFVDIEQSNHNYKELEINALGTVWNLLLDKPYSDGGVEHSARIASPGEDRFYEVYQQHSGTRVIRGRLNTPGVGVVWSTEIALAWSDLQANATTNNHIPPFLRINFSRVEQQGAINWTWQPQVRWDPTSEKFEGKVNMHMPDSWGYFVLDPTLKRDFRDPCWPARLTATTLYYALHQFKEQHGHFTANVTDLVVPNDIVYPFDIAIETAGDNSSFVATIMSRIDGTAVIIHNDRLLQVIENSVSAAKAT